ncbi:MAG: esterase [Sulfurospirillaceae bacterium]|jgi:predicted esterase YcpF (UPF0227 family)|nr:esterase [Sulfurospirillaceae bacterium]MDD2825334.1 esterase [Sulfurospirillaceae bacterium]
MILYIHGFGSSGEASKAKALRYFCHQKQIRFIAPSLPSIPDLAIKTLSELIESYQENEPVSLIGSSLGGYYALYLSDKYNLKAALINPAVNAPETLHQALGHGINYYDNSSYEWNESHLDMLVNYEIEEPEEETILLLLQKGDEVLDYEEACDALPNAQTILEEGGNHSFEGIERHFETIVAFLNAE